jgi:hypothetical protein
MRAADTVEKVTRKNPRYLYAHKGQLLSVMKSADHKELKWHIAQLMPRIPLSPQELTDVWHILSYWVRNTNESRIVRVNALQALFDIQTLHPRFTEDFRATLGSLKREQVPSLQARIRKLVQTGS